MSKTEKLLSKMRANPNDWTPKRLLTVAKQYGLTVRQKGTSHAVFTNKQGHHLAIPMHKPVKPIYVKRLIELIEE